MCAVRGRDIGMIFQEPMTALNPLQTIGDQVAETVRVHGRRSRREARAIARATLDRVGLPADRSSRSRAIRTSSRVASVSASASPWRSRSGPSS
jgi:peptide/nickel transport system ATP-binding protein